MVHHSDEFTRATVRVEECFECLGTKATTANCHFMRGVMAGAFSSLTDRPLMAEETFCAAMGGKACVFEVKPETSK